MVDPLADEFENVSPYNYVMNNPILMIDPTGMAVDTSGFLNQVIETVVVTAQRAGNYLSSPEFAMAFGDLMSGGQVSDMERSLELYRTEGMNSYLFSEIGSANRDARFSMAGQYRGGKGLVKQGKLKILGSGFSSSERKAAEYLKKKGYNVVLREPKGRRGEGGTSDLLVNGKTYDVYTPKPITPRVLCQQ